MKRLEPVATHTVCVTGGRTGEYPLTWAQQSLLRWQRVTGGNQAALNVPRAMSLEKEPSLAAVLDAVGRTVQRHDSLRTIIEAGTDGRPRQRVLAGGELPVPVYEAPPDQVVAVKDALLLPLRRRPFAAGELPLRLALVTSAGIPVTVLFCLHHLVADALGGSLVGEEIVRRSRDPDAPLAAAWQPADLIRYERGEPGIRLTERAIRHWRRQLWSAPNTTFPIRPRPGGAGPALEVVSESDATAAATRVLGQRHGTGEPEVLFAAFALLVSVFSGRPGCSVNVASANRVSEPLRASVGNLFQYVPSTVEVDGTFGRLIRRARAALLGAYRSGHYDPVAADRVRAEVREQRGVRADLSCAINIGLPTGSPYQRDADESRRGITRYTGASAASIRQLRATTEIRAIRETEHAPVGLYLAVWWLAERAVTTLAADPRLFRLDQVYAMQQSIERILVAAACAETDLDTGELVERAGAVRPDPVPAELTLVDGCWVDPAAVRDLVAAASGVTGAEVFIDRPADGPARITAYLTAEAGGTPESIHADCVAALSGRPFVVTPHEYLVGPDRPDRPRDRAAWRSMPVRQAGSGRR